ncbi:MAG: magnesium transporter [bacterium]
MTETLETVQEDDRLQRMQGLLDSGAMRQAARLINSLAPAEVAHLLEGMPLPQRELLWGLVDESQDGEILMQVTESVRSDLLDKMDASEILATASGLDMDDLADLVQELPVAITREIMSSLDGQRRRRLETVLSYPEDTAGGLMDTDMVSVRPDVTLRVVLRHLRMLGDQVPRNTDQLFVINRDDQYLGTIRLSDLVTHDKDCSVAEVMTLDVKAIPANTDDNEVAQRFEQYDLMSAAVVDDDGKLIGRITVDDVVDLIREEGEHMLMGSAGLSEDEDMFAPVLSSTRRRALWLGVNLLTAFLASWVIRNFEHTLDQVVALAVLMPIVASMGGVAGSQTLTLAIRGIALGQLSSQNARSLLAKELAVGLINSLIWALVVAVIAGAWFDSTQIAFLIAAAMTINLVFAALSGALLPILLDKMGIDPALAGTVLLTTVTDVVGFLAFLGLATIFLL